MRIDLRKRVFTTAEARFIVAKLEQALERGLVARRSENNRYLLASFRGEEGGGISPKWNIKIYEYGLKKGGHTCYAAQGLNKHHAIFGLGPCYITHPSDAAPALVALQAEVDIHGPRGPRSEPLADFFRLPHQSLWQENGLERGDVVTRVRVPRPAPGTRSTYLKFREKQSLDFAIFECIQEQAAKKGIEYKGGPAL